MNKQKNSNSPGIMKSYRIVQEENFTYQLTPVGKSKEQKIFLHLHFDNKISNKKEKLIRTVIMRISIFEFIN